MCGVLCFLPCCHMCFQASCSDPDSQGCLHHLNCVSHSFLQCEIAFGVGRKSAGNNAAVLLVLPILPHSATSFAALTSWQPVFKEFTSMPTADCMQCFVLLSL